MSTYRQSSQRRAKGAGAGSNQLTTAMPVSAALISASNGATANNNNSNGGGGGGGVKSFSPNLNLYSNYLLNQQANSHHFSPSQMAPSSTQTNNPQHQQQLLLQTTAVSQTSKNDNQNNTATSARLKKFKQQRQTHQAENHHRLDHHLMTQTGPIPISSWRDKLESSNGQIFHSQNNTRSHPATAGSKTRPQQYNGGGGVSGSGGATKTTDFVTRMAQANSTTMNIDRNSGVLLHQMQQQSMPQMTKAKSGGANTAKASKPNPNKDNHNIYSSSVLTINQLKPVKPLSVVIGPSGVPSPSGKTCQSNATSSPNTTIINLNHHQPMASMIAKPGGGGQQEQSSKVKLVDNLSSGMASHDEAITPVDQVYLIGGDQKRNNLNTAAVGHRHPTTIFDYNMTTGASQASSGNFIFQPVIQSPQAKVPQPQTFKGQITKTNTGKDQKRQSNKPLTNLTKDGSSRVQLNSGLLSQASHGGGRNAATGRASSTNKQGGRNRSRKASQHSNSGLQNQHQLYQSPQHSSNRAQATSSQQSAASFYQQFVSRNVNSQTSTAGFQNSKESLKASQQQIMMMQDGAASSSHHPKKRGWDSRKFSKTQNAHLSSPQASSTQAANPNATANYMLVSHTNQPSLKQVLGKKQSRDSNAGSAVKEQFGQNNATSGGATKSVMSMKQLNTSPTQIEEDHPLTAKGPPDLTSMLVARNVQTATGGQRGTLKSNLNQISDGRGGLGGGTRSKFILRQNQQFTANHIATYQSQNTTAQGTAGKRSIKKSESRSPSTAIQNATLIQQQQNNGPASTVRQKKESSRLLLDSKYDDQQDLNLTVIQTEDLNQMPRESYMVAHHNNHQGGGVLTPELLHSSATHLNNAEVFYRSPNHQQQQLMMKQDQHQTYFTSDSHERLASNQILLQHQQPTSNQKRQYNNSFALQGSPRASYYSPQRKNESQSKNFWLNDTIPVASPQRNVMTPSQLEALNSNNALSSGQHSANKSNAKQLQKVSGVTNLGTSYDFNKLKKGLDSVQIRNNTKMTGQDGSSYHRVNTQNSNDNLMKVQANAQVGDLDKLEQVYAAGAGNQAQNAVTKQTLKVKKVTTKDLKELIERDQALTKNEKPTDVDQKLQPKPKPSTEEVIVFSDNHSIDDYVIGKEIGKGAYATVHIGVHKRYNKKVAMKIYLKDKMKDLQRKKSVRREIKLMRRLDHPNIAELYDAIETDTKVILVMEYVGGGSTHGFLKSKPNRQMDESEARKIFAQLISALNYLHLKSIAHRDIKLENVMLDHQGNVKLIDFGFSTQIPNTQKIKLFCGTPSYMAPEIVKKIEFCGPPADIYATGVLLFAFFCGCFPYRGKDDKDLYKKIANDDLVIPDHVPLIPKTLIVCMLQKDPEARPTSNLLFTEQWVQQGLQNINSRSAKQQQTRSNSIKRRNQKSKPCSPSYMPGQKTTITPLSDNKTQNGGAQNQQQIMNGLVYDHRNPLLNNRRVVIGSADNSARSNMTSLTNGTAGARSNIVRSPRDQLFQHQQNMHYHNRASDVGSNTNSSSIRALSNQNNHRINKKRMAQTQSSNMTMNLISGGGDQQHQQRMATQEDETSEQIKTKNTIAYNRHKQPKGGATGPNKTLGHHKKPSTPVGMGRYQTRNAITGGVGGKASINQAGSNGSGNRATVKLKVNTDRASNLLDENQLGIISAPGIKLVHTVRNNTTRQEAVVDKNDLTVQAHTSRGEPSNRRQINPSSKQTHVSPPHTNSASSNPNASSNYPSGTAATLSPTAAASERFPGRKHSGPGFFNSEAYKAYYTHSAAANNASNTASSSNNSNNVGQGQQQPNIGIAQEGPLLAGPNGASSATSSSKSPQQKNNATTKGGETGHQTINNNINIINYITQIACSHPSHEDQQQHQQQSSPSTNPRPPPGLNQQNAAENQSRPNKSSPFISHLPGGVYSPTGKSSYNSNPKSGPRHQ